MLTQPSKFKCQVCWQQTDAGVISGFFSLPLQYVGKKTVEDSAETFVYYVRNGIGIPQHFAKGCDFVF